MPSHHYYKLLIIWSSTQPHLLELPIKLAHAISCENTGSVLQVRIFRTEAALVTLAVQLATVGVLVSTGGWAVAPTGVVGQGLLAGQGCRRMISRLGIEGAVHDFYLRGPH